MGKVVSDNNLSDRVMIGKWILDKRDSTLKSDALSIKLEPLPFAFLCFLVSKHGELVSREQLLESVWQNRIVSDDSIRKVVKKLREALGDDAKSPAYIKTIPLKGYCLVAKVQEAIDEDTIYGKRLFGLLLIITVVVVISLTMYVEFSQRTQTSALDTNEPSIELLTNLSGSELDADFNAEQNLLIFNYRNNNNDPYQLYSKNLNNGLVTRLTWDQGNYQNARFSPDGKFIAYWKSGVQGESTYVANYDATSGLSNIVPVKGNKVLLSWAVDGKSLYVTDSQGDKQSIYRLNLATQKVQQLTFPNVEGFGDYQVQESPSGEYLAILRNVSDRNYAMLIIERHTMKVLDTKSFTFFADSIVWQPDGKSLALSSFKGDFYYYSVTEEHLLEQAGSTPGLNDVFYTCGEKCFFMREHNMNYTDIREIPNPFLEHAGMSNLLLGSDNADFRPAYNLNADTVYYTSKDDKYAVIVSHVLGETPEVLHSFNPRFLITDLKVNFQETHLLGKVEDRIFILDLATDKLNYITTSMEIVGHPTWGQKGTSIYFSRVEQHQNVLLEYDIASDVLSRKSQGTIMRKELQDGRVFVVDEEQNLYQMKDESEKRFIVRLPFTYSDFWQVQDDFLYYSHNDGDDFYLSRINLTSGSQQDHLMAENTWQMGFDLHPNGRKLLVTQPLLADSNLVKVRWK